MSHPIDRAVQDLLAVELERVRGVMAAHTTELVGRTDALGTVLGDSLDSVWTRPEVQRLPHHGAQGRALALAVMRAGGSLVATLDAALREALAAEAARLSDLADALSVVQEARGRTTLDSVRDQLDAVARAQQQPSGDDSVAALGDLRGQLLAALGIDRASAALGRVDLDHPEGWPPAGHRGVVSRALVPSNERHTTLGHLVQAAFGQLLVSLETALRTGGAP